jgi:hypothetical protein
MYATARQKEARLIEWHVDLLLQSLKVIVAHRPSSAHFAVDLGPETLV